MLTTFATLSQATQDELMILAGLFIVVSGVVIVNVADAWSRKR